VACLEASLRSVIPGTLGWRRRRRSLTPTAALTTSMVTPTPVPHTQPRPRTHEIAYFALRRRFTEPQAAVSPSDAYADNAIPRYNEIRIDSATSARGIPAIPADFSTETRVANAQSLDAHTY
jgi:hypothetical protein